jgi:hypothetical protein
VSHTPLHNSTPEGPEQYFYGPAILSGNSAAKGSNAGVEPSPNPFAGRQTKQEPSTSTTAHHKPTQSDSGDAGAAGPTTVSGWAGEYLGSDRTTIRLPGIPKTTDEDPKARTRVDDESGGTISVSILDSGSGEELCTLSGKAQGGHVEFDPGQECFEGVLGFDASTELDHGHADFEGNRLKIAFEVTVTALDSETSGSLIYTFDGKRQ